jgi:two-component system, chemotaxis family, sensor kinase Cph1
MVAARIWCDMLTIPVEAKQVDLSTCAQEPIHIPGSIQPHGVLLVLKGPDFVVLQASKNATSVFGSDVLGRPIDNLIGGEWSNLLRDTIRSASLDRDPVYLRTVAIGRKSFHAIAHRLNGALILELESTTTDQNPSMADLYPRVRAFMAGLSNVNNVEELSALAVREVRRITGFYRVLIYKFDAEWNGHVIAEDCDPNLAPYAGLWFPASDIPEQARELYRLNRLRLIVDVDYLPVPIEPPLRPDVDEPLDLSFATLRSVSPIHIEYLKNMGIRASMSVSILRNGRLWGLISCHHGEARLVSFEHRTACDFLGQAFALQLSAAEQASDYTKRLRLKSIESQLLTFMSKEDQFLDGLTKNPVELLDLGGASGAAILFEGKCFLIGSTPSEETVRELAEWLADHHYNELFHSDRYSTLVPNPEAYAERASGVLAISISRLYRSFILWFRPEVVQTVTWGGDPTKPVERDVNGASRIHPRKSFEAWKQTVRGRSIAWDPTEIETAASLRRSILDIVLRKAEEVAQLSEELQQSNKELEAFSYSVSHDLRAPFRHIEGYSFLLREHLAGSNDKEVTRFIDIIIESAHSAGSLVDNLLHFAQIGRSTLTMHSVDQSHLVNEVKNQIKRELPAERQISWQIAPLPVVRGDLVLLRLVWQNLLSNAVKYSQPVEKAIIEVGAQEKEYEFVFFVRDNGVGFDQRYSHKLFGVFQRLHRMEDFEGTGIGLANVRRIIAKHGGRTWAEGQVGKGAVFYFSLPNLQGM